MRLFRGICFLATVSFLVLLYPRVGKTEMIPFAQALERIYELDFDGAYWGLCMAAGIPSEPQEQVQKARVLKAIVSLSQTFSCLRLLAAYRDAIEDCDQLADKKSDVLKSFEALRTQYAGDLWRWAHRLAKDTEEILEGRLDVELSIKYKGLKDLPKFVQEGIDRLDTVRKGLLPTPSQSRNIQTSEEYASFLSSLTLALGEAFHQPQTTTVITGRGEPVALLYYCSLWLFHASKYVDDENELIATSRKAASRGLELERKYPAPALKEKLMEILGII